LLIIFIPVFQLNSEQVLISSATINISKHDANVRHNLRLTLKKLSGVKIIPGQVFSFNNTVGEGSMENGYYPARVLDMDEVATEPGGGICIAASAVYNVFLLSGFEIVERHKHSRPVSYIQPGIDATILYKRKDLKLKNTSNQDFFLQGEMTSNSFIIKLYSDKPLETIYDIRTVIQEASSLASDSLSSFTVKVFRETLNGEKQGELKFLYSDNVKPIIR
jgi:vancomycin resistance protein YoaR